MARLSLLALAVMALGNNVLASLEACGPAQYDPEQVSRRQHAKWALRERLFCLALT